MKKKISPLTLFGGDFGRGGGNAFCCCQSHGSGYPVVVVDDDDIYIMVRCLYVCNVFAYFIFSHFWAPLGLEISDPQLDR